MEKKMETTIMGYIGAICWDNGTENGNYLMGYIGAICWDNGKENGNYHNGLYWGYMLG